MNPKWKGGGRKFKAKTEDNKFPFFGGGGGNATEMLTPRLFFVFQEKQTIFVSLINDFSKTHWKNLSKLDHFLSYNTFQSLKCP